MDRQKRVFNAISSTSADHSERTSSESSDPRRKFTKFMLDRGFTNEDASKAIGNGDDALAKLFQSCAYKITLPPKFFCELRRYYVESGCQAENDVVMTVHLLKPLNRTPEITYLKNRCEVKLMVRGDMPLVRLREKIFCPSDFWSNLEDFEVLSADDCFTNRFTSSFFFIHDTFYIDRRHPTSNDITQPIREFLERKPKQFGPNKIEDMANVRIGTSCRPVFLRFLDCVWQVMRQYPTSLEFNKILIFLSSTPTPRSLALFCSTSLPKQFSMAGAEAHNVLPVLQREAQLASHQIGTINRRALCPRYHRDNYPLYFLNAHRYAHARPNGTIDIQAALILDVTLFTPGADMRRLRREMVRQINERSRAWEGVMLSCRPVLHLTLDFDTLVMNYSGVEDENFHASVTNVLNKLVELMDIDLPGNPPV